MLSNYRKLAGFTNQEKLAKKLGVSRAAVARWETGERYPRTPLIPKIATLLNTTEGEIISAINATKENAKQPRQKQKAPELE